MKKPWAALLALGALISLSSLAQDKMGKERETAAELPS